MKPMFLVLLLAGSLLSARQSNPGQGQSSADFDKLRQQAQQEEMRRAAEEARVKAERERALKDLESNEVARKDLSATAPRQIPERCLASAMDRDPAVDVKNLPLKQWLTTGGNPQIQWKTQVDHPNVRMDQRFEVAYSGSVHGKDLHWSGGTQELIFVSGLSSTDGKWILPPKAGREMFTEVPSTDFSVTFRDCMFIRPGDYVLWLALYDRRTDRHSIAKQRVRIEEVAHDPLPKLASLLPVAEFPQKYNRDPLAPETIPGPLLLPVSNKRTLAVRLIPFVNPPQEWTSRIDLVHWTSNRVLATTSVLSQMKLSSGSLSVSAVDIVNQRLPFEQSGVSQLNWAGLDAAFENIVTSKVTVPALQNVKDQPAFLRNWFEQLLRPKRDSTPVLILVSAGLVFEHGSDLSPVKVEGDCQCRVYHLRLRLNKDDVFDDVAKLLKPLHPKTFDIPSAADLRKVLAEVIKDLENIE